MIYLRLLGLLALLTLLQSCLEDECSREMTYDKWIPISVDMDELRTNITTTAPRALQNPGKIYAYQDYVFVNEQREGIHVIDNSNPADPRAVSFIEIPGNRDIAVRNGVLYADQWVDLLALDLAAPEAPQLLHRTPNFLPSMGTDVDGKLIVDYDVETVTEVFNCNEGTWLWANEFATADMAGGASPLAAAPGGNGTGGSMSRFTLVGSYLYTVSDRDISVFDVSNVAQPQLLNQVNAGWRIETIFPSGNYLFLGSEVGMYIYDISDAANPVYVSEFQHARACDPVFVQGDLAYVTLRSGTECDGFTNQLDVIDISNIQQPVLQRSFQMDNPHGLSIKDQTLYLCEGEHGLKSFDISDPLTLDQRQLQQLEQYHAFDVIVMPYAQDVLLLIGEDGFYQFDCSTPGELELLSFMAVGA